MCYLRFNENILCLWRKYGWLLLLVYMSIIHSSCKKTAPIGQELQSLDVRDMFEQMMQVQNSMRPYELVLTFDDGPVVPKGQGRCSDVAKKPPRNPFDMKPAQWKIPEDRPLHSGDLVDFLIHYNIPATLFVVTKEYRDFPDSQCVLVRALLSDNITVANHSYSHVSARIKPELCNKGQDHKDAFSQLLSSEITSAQCYLEQELVKNFDPQEMRALRYPYFYRPPGGFWDVVDRNATEGDSRLDHLIGPVGWHFGGDLSEMSAADYQCWNLDSWWKKASEEEREKKLQELSPLSPMIQTALFDPEKLSMIEACAQQYVRNIFTKDPEMRRGIVLMHDNFSQTIEMFIRYLYPALQRQGFSFVSIEDVPYFAEQISSMGQRNIFEENTQFGSCKAAQNPCACCTKSDKSCC